MEIAIQYPKAKWNQRPLRHRFQGQLFDQPAYVELDCSSGVLLADYSSEIGNAVPSDVYHGHALRFRIWSGLTTKRITALLDRLAPLAAIVVAGYSSEFDGSNMRARYTEEAMSARNKMDFICSETFTEFYY